MRYLSILFCAVFVPLCLSQAQAEVPKLINYQGKLTTAEGACVDTNVSMQFAIYSDSTGWDSLWSETQLSVKVDKGVFNVLLGSVSEIPESVFTGEIRYLGIKVEDDPEMVPRKAIVSAGYSYNSRMLDGKQAGNEEGDIPINNGNLNVNLNADYLDGYDSQTLLSPVKQVIRDTMHIHWGGEFNPRTKEFSPSIDPSKAVVLLGQPYIGSESTYHVLALTSSSITILLWSTGGISLPIDYQIIEYR